MADLGRVDPLTTASHVGDVDPRQAGRVTPSSFFMRQWNLIQAFVNSTSQGFADLAALVAKLAAAKITTQTPIGGGGPLLALEPISHNMSGVAAGSYGDSTHVAQVTVDEFGHVTGAANVAISGGGGSGPSPFWSTTPTPPTTSPFTLLKGGSTTASMANVGRGVIFKLTSASSATARNALFYQAAPGATWTATALIVPNGFIAANNSLGVAVRDNTTGRIQNFAVFYNGTGNALINNWSAIDTFVGPNVLLTQAANNGAPIWIRLVLDATNLTMFFSLDGETFIQTGQTAKNSYVASIDQVGFFFSTNPAGPAPTDNAALLMSWTVV